MFTVRREIQAKVQEKLKARIDSPYVDGNCLAKIRIGNVVREEAKRRGNGRNVLEGSRSDELGWLGCCLHFV